MEEFLKCLGFPQLVLWGISALLFVAAYIIYRVFLFVFRRILRGNGFWKKLIESIRHPVLLIFFEVAAVISINILSLPEHLEQLLEHALTILIIGALGWLLAGITQAFYRNFIEKMGDGTSVNLTQRSMMTQVLFLYRFVMFAIIVITIAAILLTFPYIKSVGVGILGSAGIAGIALGIAARPILLNLMSGFQIAATKTIKIGDAVFLEGDFARIEVIHLTHVVARTWDLRRIILPISYFIDKPFQNWDAHDPELLGSVFIHCDYTVPVEEIRKKVKEILENHPGWNRKVWRVHVTNCSEKTMEIRIIMTATDASIAYDLRCDVREQLIEFLQKEYPESLPCVRYRQLT